MGTFILDEKENLRFDEEKHEYYLGKKKLISVTQLLAKHHLSPDYTGIDPDVLSSKAWYGKLIHQRMAMLNMALMLHNDVLAASLEQEYRDLYTPYKAFLAVNNLHPAGVEVMVHNDLVAGRTDLILQKDGGEGYVAEFKTTAEPHKESVSWQLSLYRYLIGDQYPGISASKGICFKIDKEQRIHSILLPLQPKEEIEELLDCERRGVIYDPKAKAERTVKDLVNSLETQMVVLDSCAKRREELTEQAMKSVEDLIDTIVEQEKQATDVVEQLKAQILTAMENNGVLAYQGDKIKLKYIAPTTRNTIDTKKLRANYPDVARDCTKQTPVKASLRITRLETKAIANDEPVR